jgi:hypothetical protein
MHNVIIYSLMTEDSFYGRILNFQYYNHVIIIIVIILVITYVSRLCYLMMLYRVHSLTSNEMKAICNVKWKRIVR